jgi:hypothetical protein
MDTDRTHLDALNSRHKSLLTRHRQAMVKLRNSIALLTMLSDGGAADQWWVEQSKEILGDTRIAYDLLAGHEEPDDILDELAAL